MFEAQQLFNMPDMYAAIFAAGALGYELNLLFLAGRALFRSLVGQVAAMTDTDTDAKIRVRIGIADPPAQSVGSVEVLDAHLSVIERLNPQLNAIVTLAAEEARAAARAAEAAVVRGDNVGTLHGLPIGIKDVTLTAGIRTTFGSPLFKDNVPADDAEVVRRLKAAGAIVLAKTNTPEFATGANTVNAVFGATRNPPGIRSLAPLVHRAAPPLRSRQACCRSRRGTGLRLLHPHSRPLFAELWESGPRRASHQIFRCPWGGTPARCMVLLRAPPKMPP